ncbi:helix-turn-helix domain-containing protein [Paenarthrobacter sp. GOM3]|uniref:helix-turn-helix domain-containing protein n=1 Tax=Paenarthrobacter sp. GOM3 TaxID=2782567 RepID=UPI001BA81751|nr:helix-turn-helix domain-containing protein [Paenarthrobacter sp. GOM3]WOH20158.1 helix-turn-helix domain-containing protein [Paenarthrobacter sp. GOM3]
MATIPTRPTLGNGAPTEAVRLYSTKDAAELMGMSDDWVRARIKDGSLRAVELGSSRQKWRVRADDLQAFIDARTDQTPAVAA